MSASEKLRALIEPGWGMSAHSERMYRLAHPQVVALVEAVEIVLNNSIDGDHEALRSTLADLDRSLDSKAAR